MESNITLTVFIIYSVLGAAAYRLAWSKSWRELFSFESAKHFGVGAIIGVLYYTLHVERGFPDTVMAFVAGWMGDDFLEAVISKMRRIWDAGDSIH